MNSYSASYEKDGTRVCAVVGVLSEMIVEKAEQKLQAKGGV